MARIELRNVSLSYPILYPQSRLLRSKIGRFRAHKSAAGPGTRSAWVYKALDDISFTVEPGTRLGLVGRNGAGKTTLLKLIAGVYKPTTGSVRREGKTETLINPNIGLDNDSTGYENIILLGRMSGLSDKFLLEKIPDIEEFTELKEFLDMPLYTYSEGMRMRLCFAITTMSSPDVLLADEYLGTGDALFIKKAYKRLSELYQRSSIVVLASHAQSIIEQLCNRALLLHKGRVLADGNVDDIFKEYQTSDALSA